MPDTVFIKCLTWDMSDHDHTGIYIHIVLKLNLKSVMRRNLEVS